MTMDPGQVQCVRANKGEEDTSHITPLNNKFPKITSSRQWSNDRNPRIVRVSRAFGGKDRHSKVCTVKGLRDRRIRLSAPTAIQLYDLQDRLGLSQPSKVVDWLLEATKEEIDKLPPLPMIPQLHQPNDPSLMPSNSQNQHLSYKDMPTVDHNVMKNNQGQGFGGFQVPHQNIFLSRNYQGDVPHYNEQSWDHHRPNLMLSQYGGGFALSQSELIDENGLNTHLNTVPSFPSYNIIPLENNNTQVMPTTLHFIRN